MSRDTGRLLQSACRTGNYSRTCKLTRMNSIITVRCASTSLVSRCRAEESGCHTVSEVRHRCSSRMYALQEEQPFRLSDMAHVVLRKVRPKDKQQPTRCSDTRLGRRMQQG